MKLVIIYKGKTLINIKTGEHKKEVCYITKGEEAKFCYEDVVDSYIDKGYELMFQGIKSDVEEYLKCKLSKKDIIAKNI